MMSAKFATAAHLKLKIFENKVYGVIIHDFDVTNKILTYDSNFIVDVVILAFLLEKLSNSKFYKGLFAPSPSDPEYG